MKTSRTLWLWVTGASYLSLHSLCLILSDSGVGLAGTSPWFAAAPAFALIVYGGLRFSSLVIPAFAVGALIALPAEMGLSRILWGLASALIIIAGAWICRVPLRVSQRSPGLAELGLGALLLFSASLATAGIASGMDGTPPFAVLFASHLSALLGVGLPLSLFLEAVLGVRAGLRQTHTPGFRAEGASQVLFVVLCVALARAWPASPLAGVAVLVPLLWIARSRGLPGVTLALVAYMVGRWAFMDLPDASLLMIQDLALVLFGVGLGALFEHLNLRMDALFSRNQAVERVLAGAQMGFWEWDGGQHLQVDRQWHGMVGYDDGWHDGLELTWRRLVHPEDLSQVLWLRDAHWKGHSRQFEAEYRLRCRDDSYRWVLDRGIVVDRDVTGQPLRMAGACLDIHVRKSSDLQQRSIVELMDSAADYIGAADINGNMIYANLSLMRLCNDADLSTVRRRHLTEYFPEQVAKCILTEGLPAAAAQGFWCIDTTLGSSAGKELPVSLQVVLHRDAAGEPRHISMIARDLSSRLRDESSRSEHVHRAELERRHESLHLLAGGLAHDMNNFLTAMMGNASLARAELHRESPAQVYFQRVEEAALEAARLCQLMHAFSGKASVCPLSVNLNDLLRELGPRLSSLCRLGLELKTELTGEGLGVTCDQGLVEEALLALVQNAVEASREGAGAILLRCTQQSIGATGAPKDALLCALAPGEYAVLEVTDQGEGIDPRLRDRVFEPYFTTKAGHAGLGLVRALAAAQAHGGTVYFSSTTASGCSVRMLLPLTKDAVRPRITEPEAPSNWRGAGLVLIIDDGESVRTVATAILESLGFTPLVAGSGHEGLRILRQHAGALRGVLLDLSMPDMDGEGVLSEIRRIDAGVPVLITSGLAEGDIEQRFKDKETAGFLRKPFSISSLRSAMYRMLEARRA